jgi:uncharacterized protein (DUF433 family)
MPMGGSNMLPEIRIPRIINRGRGPEIEGTRITVYDVMDYRKHGWHRDRIAALFSLSPDEVQVAFDYIDMHQDEVMQQYERNLEWQRNYQYPPDVQAKLDACQGLAKRKLEEIRARKKENGHDAGNSVRS